MTPRPDPRGFLGLHPMVTAVAYVVVGALPLYLTSAQFPALEDAIGLTTTTLGLATALYFGLSAVAATPVGRIVDRHGAQMGLQAGSLLSALASILAIAAGWSWVLLVIAISFAGVANTFMQVSTNVVLASQASFGRQGLGFGAKQGAIPLASMLAGILMPVVGVSIGWQWPFGLAMGIGIGAAIVAPSGARRGRTPPRTAPRDWKPSPSLRWIAFGGAFGGGAGNSLSLFLVPAAVTVGISETASGSALAVSGALVLGVRVLNGWLADRTSSSGHRGMIGSLALGALGCFALLLSTGSAPWFLIAIAIALIGSWGWQGLGFLAVVRLHPESPARASGVVLGGNLTGNMVGPLVVGYLAGGGTYTWVWIFCGVISVIACLSMMMSRHRARELDLVAEL